MVLASVFDALHEYPDWPRKDLMKLRLGLRGDESKSVVGNIVDNAIKAALVTDGTELC